MYKFIIILLALINISCADKNALTLENPSHQETKDIYLLDNKDKKMLIGSINFLTNGNKISYQIHLKYEKFTDYFLSMKEMKCLEGPELWCHLGYPYNNPRSISTADFSWLSHDLLFMYKKSSEFGANFNNGIYYDFKRDSNKIIGTAMAVDLNLLAAPPEDETTPPITIHDIDEIELSNRWLPKIIIE